MTAPKGPSPSGGALGRQSRRMQSAQFLGGAADVEDVVVSAGAESVLLRKLEKARGEQAASSN